MLKPFCDTDFELLENWVTGPDILFQFAGTGFIYPITREQLQQYRSKYPERQFYIGYTTDNVPFSFGEIIPQDNDSVRLARLLIGDPLLRGKGLGVYFVRFLIEECIARFKTNNVDLFVWDNNLAAIKCYKKAGFNFVPVEPFAMVYNNETYNLLKMTLAKS